MRFLCLSDIHGEADALAAVMATAERRSYQRVLVAGDHCFPGPSALEVWRRLVQCGALCAQGVGDRALATIDLESLQPCGDFERARFRRLVAMREELGERVLTHLAELPLVLREALPGGGQLALVHGSPRDPLEPMTHDMSDEMLLHLVADEPARLIVCGGSHVPFERAVRRPREDGTVDEIRIVNVGSVGEAPAAAGERVANATFIECSKGVILVESFAVPLSQLGQDGGVTRF